MIFRFALLCFLAPGIALAQSFDHSHSAWGVLLAKHVKEARDGLCSRVDYKGFSADRAKLKGYLDTLSAVNLAQYKRWSKPQQFAFLANAYNGFTVEKILTRYPNLKSIRDFGTLIGNPWKDRFFTLLGKAQHLDGIEHEILRVPGVFDEPRVHVAVNCASIGCPMLARRPFTADRLDAQLEDLMQRFLSDRSRNRYDPQSGMLALSKIFDWYEGDFKKGGKSFLGYPGFASVAGVGVRYADQLADSKSHRTALRANRVGVRHLKYDWGLNDIRR